MVHDVKPDPRIADYIRQVSEAGVPYVSYSHVTLRRLYSEHGRTVIDKLLSDHWSNLRKTREMNHG